MQHPVQAGAVPQFPRLPASCTHAYLHASTSPRIPDPSHRTITFSQQPLREQPLSTKHISQQFSLPRPRYTSCARQKPTLAMGALPHAQPWPHYSDWFALVPSCRGSRVCLPMEHPYPRRFRVWSVQCRSRPNDQKSSRCLTIVPCEPPSPLDIH